MKTRVQLFSLTIAVSSVASSSYASDAIGPGDSDSRWVVGGSVVRFNNIYAGEDNRTALIPNIIYNGERFFVKNSTLNLALGQYNQFSAGLIVSPQGSFLSDEDEYEDNAKLAGLKERDATVEGGFYINHTTDPGRLKFIVLTDLGSEHEGQSALLKYTFDLKYGGWYINPVVGMNWISDKKVNHFYGVSAAEATPVNGVFPVPTFVRTTYEGDSAVNIFAGVRARYELTKHWDVSVAAGAVRLDSSIENSSIVDDGYIYHSAVSVSYNF